MLPDQRARLLRLVEDEELDSPPHIYPQEVSGRLRSAPPEVRAWVERMLEAKRQISHLAYQIAFYQTSALQERLLVRRLTEFWKEVRGKVRDPRLHERFPRYLPPALRETEGAYDYVLEVINDPERRSRGLELAVNDFVYAAHEIITLYGLAHTEGPHTEGSLAEVGPEARSLPPCPGPLRREMRHRKCVSLELTHHRRPKKPKKP